MSGSSPLRNGLSLAQRFTWRPSESGVSALTSSASKRRKLASGDASISTSSTVLTTSDDGGNSTTVQSTTVTLSEPKSPSKGASANGDVKANGTSDSKGKKRALSPETSESTLANDVARAFSASLSDKEISGVGGSLSEKQLLALESETMHPSWLQALSKELRSPYFLKLKRFLWTEGVKNSHEASKNIFPPAREIYSWSRYTPLDKVRIVILGQDPYHNDGQAHGLAFSVRDNVKIPPSLKNIYKEIKTDYPDFAVPKHGYLASWAKQGVLLLNTSLTVRAHQANSHSKKGWEELTDAILRVIDARPGPGVVFLVWGQPALKRMAGIDKEKHLILSSVHPSPLSASRGFFGNQHFKKANEWLAEKYGQEAVVDWTKVEPEKAVKEANSEPVPVIDDAVW